MLEETRIPSEPFWDVLCQAGCCLHHTSSQDTFRAGREEAQDAQHVLATATNVTQVHGGKASLLEPAPAQPLPTSPLPSPRCAASQGFQPDLPAEQAWATLARAQQRIRTPTRGRMSPPTASAQHQSRVPGKSPGRVFLEGKRDPRG